MSVWQPVEASNHAKNTTNPIRKIVDQMKAPSKSTKPMISLSIGDPTTDGHLFPPTIAETSIIEKLKGHKANGYPPSVGYLSSRVAVANYWKRSFAPSLEEDINPDNVILGSGASHSLLMAITALCNPGDVLLLPEPCFSLYGTICESYGIRVNFYRCLAERDWEIDLEDLKVKASIAGTKALLLNNPSNPCGSSFKRAHVEAIMKVCDDAKIPVIADEIYAGQVFTGHTFTSVSDIASPVPRIVVGGLAKNFMCPGWRLGWSITVDPSKVLGEVHNGMVALSTLIVGPNSLIQATLDDILNHADAGYASSVIKEVENTATQAYTMFQTCKGLKPTTPQGAMYLMIGIDSAVLGSKYSNGIEFAKTLLEEENVQVLPGEIFRCPGYFRIVTAKPVTVVMEAVERIQQFCARHAQ